MPELIRWRLSPRLRKTTLAVHIAAAGAWLGIDLVLGVLVVTAFTAPAVQAAAAALTIASFTTVPLVTVGLVTLLTGIVLGIGSKYGLMRYWWVLVKLVLNIVLTTLVLVLLAPGVEELRSAGLTALGAGAAPDVPSTMLFPPIVSSSAVVVAITLSVFKPWGRLRRSRRATRGSQSEEVPTGPRHQLAPR